MTLNRRVRKGSITVYRNKKGKPYFLPEIVDEQI